MTLLATLCACRLTEITDSLIELLLGVVHRVNARAENRVESELVADLKRVRGKQSILFALAEAAVEHPDETVRRALYPVVGKSTLRDLVREAKANEAAFRARVRTVLRASYSSHYRRMLPRLLAALDFRCNNSAYRPVTDAVVLLRRYAERDRVHFYDPAERVPMDGVVPASWRSAVVEQGGRVARIPYELCVLVALRAAIRRREVWVAGAGRWRDPEDDLPTDFDSNRDVHYAALPRAAGSDSGRTPRWSRPRITSTRWPPIATASQSAWATSRTCAPEHAGPQRAHHPRRPCRPCRLAVDC